MAESFSHEPRTCNLMCTLKIFNTDNTTEPRCLALIITVRICFYLINVVQVKAQNENFILILEGPGPPRILIGSAWSIRRCSSISKCFRQSSYILLLVIAIAQVVEISCENTSVSLLIYGWMLDCEMFYKWPASMLFYVPYVFWFSVILTTKAMFGNISCNRDETDKVAENNWTDNIAENSSTLN